MIGNLDIDIFDEFNESSKNVKSDEEINKFLTSESFTPLMKAVHILKKGFDIQKRSIVANLDKYLTEPEAGKQLIEPISKAIEFWDNDFQTDCAESFVRVLDKGLLKTQDADTVMKVSLELMDN